jgi:outer membrane protein OmpA-like peptidoglycan-associated protein
MSREDEVKMLQYDEGTIVCWSPAYRKRELRSDDPHAPAIILGMLQCQLTPSDNDYDLVKHMTGRYESPDSVCCVNQAGHHMEIWFSSKSGGRRLFRYGADYQPAAPGEHATFELREPGDPTPFLNPATPGLARTTPAGLLLVEDAMSFKIQWADGSHSEFRRFSPRATLSDRVIEQLRAEKFGGGHPIVEGWLANEHTPVSEERINLLLDAVVHDRASDGERSFAQMFRALFAMEPERHRADVHVEILAIKKSLKELLKGAFEPADKGIVASRVLPELLRSTLTIRNPSGVFEVRSRYAWLQRVIGYNEFTISRDPRDVADIIQWLGVQPTKTFRYEYDGVFQVLGADASLPFASKLAKLAKRGKYLAKKGVAKLLDKIEEFRWDWGTSLKKHRKKIEDKLIEKVGGAIADLLEAHAGGKVLWGMLRVRAPDGSWEAAYDVLATVGSLGLGGTQLGVEEMTVKGWSESPVDWKPSNFPGRFAFLPGVMATDAHGKRAEKQMIWLLDGGGSTGTMQVVFDEVKTDASDMDLGWGFGAIDDLDADDVPHTTFARRPMFEYTTAYKQDNAIQFQLGSATLRWSGRQMLRVFAANELALLRDPMSRVDVEAFADRPGQRWYNKQLSLARAANIRQALIDCLGGDLNATVETQGHGEDVLAALGEALYPDEVPSEQWRRGFVVMNAQVAATLGTNDPSVRGKKK